jgi:hypothetical protein
MARAARQATVEIDLNTRVLNRDDPIYVLFPGEDYSLYNLIRNRSVVALDFLGWTSATRAQLRNFRTYVNGSRWPPAFGIGTRLVPTPANSRRGTSKTTVDIL